MKCCPLGTTAVVSNTSAGTVCKDPRDQAWWLWRLSHRRRCGRATEPPPETPGAPSFTTLLIIRNSALDSCDVGVLGSGSVYKRMEGWVRSPTHARVDSLIQAGVRLSGTWFLVTYIPVSSHLPMFCKEAQ